MPHSKGTMSSCKRPLPLAKVSASSYLQLWMLAVSRRTVKSLHIPHPDRVVVTVVISPLLALMVSSDVFLLVSICLTSHFQEQSNSFSPRCQHQSCNHQQYCVTKCQRSCSRGLEVWTSSYSSSLCHSRILPNGSLQTSSTYSPRTARARSYSRRRGSLYLRMGTRLPPVLSGAWLVQGRVS